MKESENILLLGLGGLGYYLAKRLSQEGHKVTAIEQDRTLIEKAQLELDARLILGSATDFRCWQKANASEHDYLVAMTNDDSVNLMASLFAKKFGIKHKVIRNSNIDMWAGDAVLTKDDMFIDYMIRPEELSALEVVRLCRMRAGNVVVNVGDGELQIIAMSPKTRRLCICSSLQLPKNTQKYRFTSFVSPAIFKR
jgi:trk system potassium uptake protein TrkA